jgi:hypothetical protein
MSLFPETATGEWRFGRREEGRLDNSEKCRAGEVLQPPAILCSIANFFLLFNAVLEVELHILWVLFFSFFFLHKCRILLLEEILEII